MNRQEKIAYLRRYRDNEREIDRLMDEIERTRSFAEKVTASYTLAPARGVDDGGDRVQTGVERIGELCERLDARLCRKVELREEIERAIDTVEDERLREVLELRYMNGVTFEALSACLHLDERWIYRLHRKAINKLTIKSQY